MPTVTLTDLMSGVQTALTTGANPLFASNTCCYSLSPLKTLEMAPSDQYAVIQPIGLKTDTRTFASDSGGPGRINYILRWEAILWIFSRLATDRAHNDEEYLLDEAYGSIPVVNDVINLFQVYRTTTEPVWGYQVDGCQWGKWNRNSVGWAGTMIKLSSTLTGH